jgi:hypothetical protein
MNTELNNRYNNLCNSLRLFAYPFNSLVKLDGPNFDIEFEISSEFDLGLSAENVEFLFTHKKISKSVKDAILDLREDLILIPDVFWTIEELESNSMWDKIRIKSNAILDESKINNKEYDFTVVKIF